MLSLTACLWLEEVSGWGVEYSTNIPFPSLPLSGCYYRCHSKCMNLITKPCVRSKVSHQSE